MSPWMLMRTHYLLQNRLEELCVHDEFLNILLTIVSTKLLGTASPNKCSETTMFKWTKFQDLWNCSRLLEKSLFENAICGRNETGKNEICEAHI